MTSMRRIAIATGLAALLATAAGPAFAQPTSPSTPGEFSKAQLAEAQKTVTDRLAQDTPDGIASWGVDPSTGKLRVNVVKSDTGALTKAQSAIADLPQAEIAYVSERPRLFWSIVNGSAITTGGYRCSAGFNARTSAGVRYLITAGHCTDLGGTWSGDGGVIGPMSNSSFPTNDYGRIQVTQTAAASTALVSRYTSGSNVTVTGAGSPAVGASTCRSGSTTGWHCGTVQALNQTVNYGNGDLVYGLTKTNACAEPGDSGGSFVSNPGTGTQAQAYGLTSGGSGDCSVGGTTYFQPIGEALSAYGLTLYTG